MQNSIANKKAAPPGGGGDGSAEKNAALAAFSVREARLCGELGMSKDELRRRREYFLTQGKHWDYVDKRVMLSLAGAEVLRGTAKAVVPPAPVKNAATGDSARTRGAVALLPERCESSVVFDGQLVVWALPPRNPRLVVAYVPGTDPNNPMNLVSLMVRENGNFMRGMAVPGKHTGVMVRKVSETSYELQGQCPRWKGRW